MGEPFFIGERHTEDWLALETRRLFLPDGSERPFTMFRLTWRSYDRIIANGLYTGPEIVGLSIAGCNETGRRFEDDFPSLVAYIHGRIRERDNERIEYLRHRLRKAQTSFRTSFRSAATGD